MLACDCSSSRYLHGVALPMRNWLIQVAVFCLVYDILIGARVLYILASK